jgi:hypothetical protein
MTVVSSIDGDDTTMEEPNVEVIVNLNQLEEQQALMIAEQAGLDQQPDRALGKVMKGDPDFSTDDLHNAHFYLPLEAGFEMLVEVGAIDIEQPEPEAELPDEDVNIVDDNE